MNYTISNGKAISQEAAQKALLTTSHLPPTLETRTTMSLNNPQDVPPNVLGWLHHETGVVLPDRTVEIAIEFFRRYRKHWQGIVVMQDGIAESWPRAYELNRQNEALIAKQGSTTSKLTSPTSPTSDNAPKPAQPVASGKPYAPLKRVKDPNSWRKHEVVVERITASRIVLRRSPARIMDWGINLSLLENEQCPSSQDKDCGMGSFNSWLALNQLDELRISREAYPLFEAAYAVAFMERNDRTKDRTKKFRKPKLPLIHNQRCGTRYILLFDGRNMGSPADVHILLYPAGGITPHLTSWDTSDIPKADERKPGLLLLASEDMRIRFYQTTDAQWEEWKKHPIDYGALPESVREIVRKGCEAAEKLRQKG